VSVLQDRSPSWPRLTPPLLSQGAGLVFGGLYGGCVSAWQSKHNVAHDGVTLSDKALPSTSRLARVVGRQASLFAAVGATYAFAEGVAETVRCTKDPINGMAGGFAAGSLLGFRHKSVPVMIGMGIGCSLLSLAGELQPRMLDDPERYYKKWHSLRPRPAGMEGAAPAAAKPKDGEQ